MKNLYYGSYFEERRTAISRANRFGAGCIMAALGILSVSVVTLIIILALTI